MVLHWVRVSALTHVIDELIEYWSKKRWTAKANVALSFSVVHDNVLDTLNLRCSHISVKGEAVVNRVHTHVSRNSTEAEHREHCRLIVRLNNPTNAINSAFILVVLTEKMEGGRVAGLSVGSSVVNCQNERNLSASL